MGNTPPYQSLPPRPPLPFQPHKHELETIYVQRIKQTPFSHSEPYSIQPPIFMDSVGVTMRDLVGPRVSRQQFFPPDEVVKIMGNVLAGLVELEGRGFVAHGDLSFDTIYYDKRNKIFRIMHPVFSPESGYQLTKTSKRFSLLSPQQLIALTDQQYSPPNLATLKSDLFILGILMLQICTLIPSSEIYCPETYIIFDKEIQNRMELIREYYRSEPLCEKFLGIIGELLEYDEEVRKGVREVLGMVERLGGARGGVGGQGVGVGGQQVQQGVIQQGLVQQGMQNVIYTQGGGQLPPGMIYQQPQSQQNIPNAYNGSGVMPAQMANYIKR